MLPLYISGPLGLVYLFTLLAGFVVFGAYSEGEEQPKDFEKKWSTEIERQRNHLFLFFRSTVSFPKLPLTPDKITRYVGEVRWYLDWSHWVRRLIWSVLATVLLLIQVHYGSAVAAIDVELEEKLNISIQHPPPYLPATIAELEGYLTQQLALKTKYEALEEKAIEQNWTPQVAVPYNEVEIDGLQQQIDFNDKMKSQIAVLKADLGIDLTPPYLQNSYDSLPLTLHHVPISPGLVAVKGKQIPVDHSFEIMAFEVAQILYEGVMHTNPSAIRCSSCPVERVSWLDAVLFANALNESMQLQTCYEIKGVGKDKTVAWLLGLKCKGWRLPTEAEWILAARGGVEGEPSSEQIAATVTVIGSAEANNHGTYDQIGNVAEWVWDPAELTSGERRRRSLNLAVDERIRIGDEETVEMIFRGGSSRRSNSKLDFDTRRPELWFNFGDQLGFRLVRTLFIEEAVD